MEVKIQKKKVFSLSERQLNNRLSKSHHRGFQAGYGSAVGIMILESDDFKTIALMFAEYVCNVNMQECICDLLTFVEDEKQFFQKILYALKEEDQNPQLIKYVQKIIKEEYK